EVIQRLDLAVEPAARLYAARPGIEGRDAERRIGFFPKRLPAAMGKPARRLRRGKAEKDAREIVEGGVLALPVIGRAMPHLADALRNRIEHFEGRHDLASAIEFHGKPPARHRADPV